ncbi:GEVED domain-containing protein, partial [Planctomycetota bacterium]
WIDLNNDGDWDDLGERVITNAQLSQGANLLSFNQGTAKLLGLKFVRFRFSSQNILSPTGYAPDGEVEDYQMELVNLEHGDLGDAPDATNSTGSTMYAYPGVIANFPTNWNWQNFIQGIPPHGPIHWRPRDRVYLGQSVSLEADAETGFDEDATNNIMPQSNQANLDGYDDGIQLPLFPPNAPDYMFPYTVTVTSGSPTQDYYVNVWFDWNRDGDWEDSPLNINGMTTPEYAVENHIVTLAPGTHTLLTPNFMTITQTVNGVIQPVWMRIQITTRTAYGDHGAGPDTGYQYGETEDYLVTPAPYPEGESDYGDAPAQYPDASHIIGDSWLGNLTDQPDAESGTQADLFALGDDNDGNDDENGLFMMGGALVKHPTNTTLFKHSFIMDPSILQDVMVAAWIDFNGDGDWNDTGEALNVGYIHLPASHPLYVGSFTWLLHIPANSITGVTFARVRLYTDPTITPSPSGAGGIGEVCDYEVEIIEDGETLPPGGIISGRKWNDLNGNQIHDVGEPVLPNWSIWLDANQNGVDDAGDQYAQTNANGFFTFSGLSTGQYLVGEDIPPGWIQTWPGSPNTHTVIADPTQPSAGILFGNRQIDPGGNTDYGDAPDPTYPTLLTNNGARHTIVDGFHLGANIDDEPDGQPSPDAQGDNGLGINDEDGIFFVMSLLPGQQAIVEATASAPGCLDAWIDFDADGNWSQAYDRIFASQVIQSGSNLLQFQVPAGISTDIDTYARFRFSSDGALGPNGPAQDGEVEDYHILLGEDGPIVSGEGEVPHVKWSQPPIEIDPNLNEDPVFCGWGEVATSTGNEGELRFWSMKFDDFHCLGSIPVTGIRWWGSYEAWSLLEPPEASPDFWRIVFWAAEPNEYLEVSALPERPVHILRISADRVRVKPAGIVQFPDSWPDTCFSYEVMLEPDEFFYQADHISDEDVFWISITAGYRQATVTQNPWGWLTRPYVWRDEAKSSVLYYEGPTEETLMLPEEFTTLETDSFCDRLQGYDLCFELLTKDPWIKWDQPFTNLRDWPNYDDHYSFAIEDEEYNLHFERRLTDDWMCVRTDPVVAISWYGSYVGYGYEACKCDQVTEPNRPDYFILQLRKQTNDPGS